MQIKYKVQNQTIKVEDIKDYYIDEVLTESSINRLKDKLKADLSFTQEFKRKLRDIMEDEDATNYFISPKVFDKLRKQARKVCLNCYGRGEYFKYVGSDIIHKVKCNH